jgi:hypothetical protein
MWQECGILSCCCCLHWCPPHKSLVTMQPICALAFAQPKSMQLQVAMQPHSTQSFASAAVACIPTHYHLYSLETTNMLLTLSGSRSTTVDRPGVLVVDASDRRAGELSYMCRLHAVALSLWAEATKLSLCLLQHLTCTCSRSGCCSSQLSVQTDSSQRAHH